MRRLKPAATAEAEVSVAELAIESPTMAGPMPAADPVRAALDRTWRRRPGLYGWLISTNHKDIGLRFVVTAFVLFGLAGARALLMRIQLAVPGNTFLGPDAYNQVFPTHGTTMMFLFAVPVMEGMG